MFCCFDRRRLDMRLAAIHHSLEVSVFPFKHDRSIAIAMELGNHVALLIPVLCAVHKGICGRF